MGYLVVGLVCFIAGGFVNYFFTKRMIQKLLQENNSGGNVVSPEVIKTIIERAIEVHEMGKTTEEIIEEMNNLPEYKP